VIEMTTRAGGLGEVAQSSDSICLKLTQTLIQGKPMKIRALLMALLGVVATTIAANQVAGQGEERWTQWRGENRQGKSPSSGLNQDWEKNPPKLVWKKEGVGNGFASLSIAEGMIFTTGNFNNDQENGQFAVAMDVETGEVKWRTQITDQVPKHDYEGARTTPTYDDGHLYIVSSDGGIVCLKAETGKKVWGRSFQDWGGRMMSGWGFSESPLIDEEKVVFTPGGENATVVACNKKTGKEIWHCAVPKIGDGKNHHGGDLPSGAGYSSIIISEAGGVRQYVQLLGQGLVGIRATNGELLWGYEDCANSVANISTPIADGNFIFCSTAYGAGSALLKLSKKGKGIVAEEVYFLDPDTLQNHHGGMVLLDGYIYCGHGQNNGEPKCVQLKDGALMWDRARGEGSGSAAILFVDGDLIMRYDNGVIALVEANSSEYKVKGSFTPEHVEGPSWAHPVVVNGKLYLREQNVMMCYDLQAQ
jgi:outer membrane protein assembly factor BamB